MKGDWQNENSTITEQPATVQKCAVWRKNKGTKRRPTGQPLNLLWQNEGNRERDKKGTELGTWKMNCKNN